MRASAILVSLSFVLLLIRKIKDLRFLGFNIRRQSTRKGKNASHLGFLLFLTFFEPAGLTQTSRPANSPLQLMGLARAAATAAAASMQPYPKWVERPFAS